MSRRYDESRCYLPDEAIYRGIYWQDGVGYALIYPYKDYYVTSEGDVISRKKERPRYLKQWHTNHGHLYVDLSENGVRERRLVHKLVADAFLCNPNHYPIVRHLDDDPENNNYRNLAFGTAMDNRKDMIINGHDYKRGVYCYETDTVYSSCRGAARDLGVDYSAITLCCQGKTHTCAGYHLCYAQDIDEKLSDPDWLRVRTPYKPVIAISPEGVWMDFPSRKEAAEYIGIPDCGISSVLSGHQPHSHGWRFKEGASNGQAY